MTTVGLAMMVKNETHVIERCLRSVRHLVDHWLIVDTGSTDGTQDMIRDLMADLPGQVYQRPFVDFGYNRTEAVQAARVGADYTLVIDADDVLETPPGFRWPDLDVDLVEAVHRYASLACRRPILLSNRLSWHYDGVRDEYLHAPREVRSLVLPDATVRVHGDGGRTVGRSSAELRAEDAAVLAEALRERGDHAGHQYHLARALRDSNQLPEALEAFRCRVRMGGHVEEVASSLLEIGRLLERTGAAPELVNAAYLEAWDNRPTRAEPLVALAQYSRTQNRFSVACMAARQARAIPRPDDVLWIDEDAYAWRCHDELAVNSYWTGDHATCAALCRELLAGGRLPDGERARVTANLRYAEERLEAAAPPRWSAAELDSEMEPAQTHQPDSETAEPESPTEAGQGTYDDSAGDEFEEAVRLVRVPTEQTSRTVPRPHSGADEALHLPTAAIRHDSDEAAQPMSVESISAGLESLWSRGPQGAVVIPRSIRLRAEGGIYSE